LTWYDGRLTDLPLTVTPRCETSWRAAGRRHRETHAVNDVVKAGLEELQQVFTRVALLGRGLLVVVAELTLQQTVDTLDLLLLAQLGGVVGQLALAGGRAMLAGLLLELALGVEARADDFSERSAPSRRESLHLGPI
jgi:hypothetical protein